MTVRERVERIHKECSGVWGLSGVNDWEKQRLAEWRGLVSLSPKQEAILESIERKVFGS